MHTHNIHQKERKTGSIHTMKYYSAFVRNKLLTHAITYMISKNIMLSKRRLMIKNACCLIPLIWSSREGLWWQKSEKQLLREGCLKKSLREFSGMMKLFYILIGRVVTKVYTIVKNASKCSLRICTFGSIESTLQFKEKIMYTNWKVSIRK